MPCFNPITAYRTESGDVVFTELARNGGGNKMFLACGQCVGCRLERSRQWAVRCLHESKLHRFNEFITLTYRDGEVPEDGSLRYRDFQLFMKRVRKARPDSRPRFFMCGEYGSVGKRPHYHACMFNFHLPDKKFWSDAKGYPEWRSEELDRLWTHGVTHVGEVNFKSAAYVARYICDKITGDLADEHYAGREPEFCHMSLKPGIGADFLRKFKSDIYPHGKVVVNGKEANPPKYYDKLFKRESELDALELAAEREFAAVRTVKDRTRERLDVRRKVAVARLNRFRKKEI